MLRALFRALFRSQKTATIRPRFALSLEALGAREMPAVLMFAPITHAMPTADAIVAQSGNTSNHLHIDLENVLISNYQ